MDDNARAAVHRFCQTSLEVAKALHELGFSSVAIRRVMHDEVSTTEIEKVCLTPVDLGGWSPYMAGIRTLAMKFGYIAQGLGFAPEDHCREYSMVDALLHDALVELLDIKKVRVVALTLHRLLAVRRGEHPIIDHSGPFLAQLMSDRKLQQQIKTQEEFSCVMINYYAKLM